MLRCAQPSSCYKRGSGEHGLCALDVTTSVFSQGRGRVVPDAMPRLLDVNPYWCEVVPWLPEVRQPFAVSTARNAEVEAIRAVLVYKTFPPSGLGLPWDVLGRHSLP